MATRSTHPRSFYLLKNEDSDELSLISQYENDVSPSSKRRKSLEKQDAINDILYATPTKDEALDKEQPTTGK